METMDWLSQPTALSAAETSLPHRPLQCVTPTPSAPSAPSAIRGVSAIACPHSIESEGKALLAYPSPAIINPAKLVHLPVVVRSRCVCSGGVTDNLRWGGDVVMNCSPS